MKGCFYAFLVLLASAGTTHAQDDKKKHLHINIYDGHIRPYIAPWTERVYPLEKGNFSLDLEGVKKSRLFFGAETSSGSGAREVDSKIGIVPNARQQFNAKVNANFL